jgi:hypothetical protein
MDKKINPMDKFDFLLGLWKLEYSVPESQFSKSMTGEGKGEFRKILNGTYVSFDYAANLSGAENSAHAIFAWSKDKELYDYWWFEDSGEYMEASCNFIDDTTLCLNWHKSLLVQTFSQIEKDRILLEMKHPKNKDKYETILKVELIRRH